MLANMINVKEFEEKYDNMETLIKSYDKPLDSYQNELLESKKVT